MRNKYQIMRIIQKSKKSIYKEEAVELKNLGRHCSEYLAMQSNLAAVNALKERSLLGQEDHQRSEIVLKSWKYVSLIILFFLDDTLSLLTTSHPVHNWTKHPVSLSHTSVHNCTIFLCSQDVGSR